MLGQKRDLKGLMASRWVEDKLTSVKGTTSLYTRKISLLNRWKWPLQRRQLYQSHIEFMQKPWIFVILNSFWRISMLIMEMYLFCSMDKPRHMPERVLQTCPKQQKRDCWYGCHGSYHHISFDFESYWLGKLSDEWYPIVFAFIANLHLWMMSIVRDTAAHFPSLSVQRAQ